MNGTWLYWTLGPLLGYLMGSVPFGFLIGKARGVDVRTVGSHNIGATNVYRTVGHGWGLFAFACDFLKGLLPTLLAQAVASRAASLPAAGDFPVAVGLACVVGHTLTCFMRFKGGKGVATAFGMLVALIPYLTLGAFALFVVTVAVSHYISLGSCLAAAALAVSIWFYPSATPVLRIVMTLLGAFVIWKHRSNLARLKNGTENKIF